MTTNNGFKIEVPQDYFSRIAAKEYSDDAGMAVIREFAQNSADAGATEVRFHFSQDILTVEDNGRGCDVETVRSRILTPLGSKKDGDAIGGFGKAKELLYFANAYWCIRTQDVEVVGSQLTVRNVQTGLDYVPGFRAAVQLPPALHAAALKAARNFLRSSERPGVRWVLNGEEVPTEIRRAARAAKDFGFAKAYVDRESRDSRIYLRTGGLLTATRWGYHGDTVGRVVIEVTGRSFDLLTPARDWFRAEEHRRAVEGWLNQLVTNARQTLADKEGDEVLFNDFEPVTPAELPANVAKGDAVPTTVGGLKAAVKFTGVAQGEAPALARADGATVTGELEFNGENAAAMLLAVRAARAKVKRPDGFDMSAMPRVEGVNRVVVHTGSKARAKVGMRWLAKNAETAVQLLAAWMTAVTAVAKRNGLPVDAVGFTFAEDVEAEFIRSNGRFGMLLNPMNVDLDDEFIADELLDRALHETAHLTTSGGHDEGFVLAEVALRRKARGATVRGAVARALRTLAVQQVEEL